MLNVKMVIIQMIWFVKRVKNDTIPMREGLIADLIDGCSRVTSNIGWRSFAFLLVSCIAISMQKAGP